MCRGWVDPCLSQTIATFSKLRLRLNNQSLILGPGMHATLLHALVSSSLPPSGNASRGLPDHYPLFTRVMEWFDHWFGESSSQDLTAGPPVEFYELSTNQWRQAKEWPPAEARWAKIYIAPGGDPDAARPEEEGWQGCKYSRSHKSRLNVGRRRLSLLGTSSRDRWTKALWNSGVTRWYLPENL